MRAAAKPVGVSPKTARALAPTPEGWVARVPVGRPEQKQSVRPNGQRLSDQSLRLIFEGLVNYQKGPMEESFHLRQLKQAL